MEEGNSIIYGLEHQTRALSPQYGEGEAIRFLIGTQSLKAGTNQVHVVELEEETGALHTKVFKHEVGEVWHLRCSPHDAATLATTHSAYDAAASQCLMAVSIFRLPTVDVIPKDMEDLSALHGRQAEDMELLHTFKPEKLEEEVKCAEWHPTEASRLGVVSESAVRVYDATARQCVASAAPHGRAHLKFTAGKWSPQCAPCQFAALQDTHIKCYDLRSGGGAPAWSVESAHAQLVRDIDFNPNRQFQLASVGDDGALKIWDFRNSKEPIFVRSDHSHWVWTVRYNTYHEQLLLTGSSDARALLTAAASVCDDGAPLDTSAVEDRHRERLEDGVLQSYEQHEDSVYCAEWSAAEPWTFASLSYDGRLVVSRHVCVCRLPYRLEDGVLQSYEQHEDSVYCAEWSAAEPWTFASLSYDGRLVLSRVPRHFKYKLLL